MKVTFISREKNDVKFAMDFTKEEFENAQIKSYQAHKGEFEIDGFRKGKAPRSIIERKYGEGIFFEDAIDILFNDNYADALKELDLEVIEAPRAEFGKIAKGEPLTVTITVACFPEVEIKNYKGVKVEKIKGTAKAEDVKNELEQMRKRNARSILVERPAKNGDTVLLDYSGFVGDVQFEGGTAERQSLVLGSGTFIPGFEEQLVGATPGEKRDVKVTFPEEYHAPDLAGKEAVFKCLVHEISEEQLPELDDEFAKDVSEYDTLEELKKATKKRLDGYAKEAALSQMKDKALEEVVKANDVELPEVLVKEEQERMVNELNQQLSYQGMSIDQYLQFSNITLDDFRKELRPDAERQVKARIVLQGVVKAENLDITDAELEKELEEMGKQYQMDVAKIKELIGEDNLVYYKKDLKIKKAIDFIFDNAEVVDPKKAEKEDK